MEKIKKLIKRVLTIYDDGIYQLWRLFLVKPTSNSQLYELPLISVIVPVYNTNHYFLRVMIESVLRQNYQNWELLLIDDASEDEGVRTLIKEYAMRDNRIKYEFLVENHHIAAATNIGIEKARGDFIGLLDHDDVLYSDTLQEIVYAINQHHGAKFFYTDEDKVIGSKRTQPFFKPSWNLGLLHCVNYITHFAIIKKDILTIAGYEDSKFNGAQDWELFLRIGRLLQPEEIIHIPKILYSWRMHELSTSVNLDVKPYVVEAQLNAVEEDIRIRGLNFKVERNAEYPGQLYVKGRSIPGLDFIQLRALLGVSRTLFIILSSRLALSRHIYRTTSYDKIVRNE